MKALVPTYGVLGGTLGFGTYGNLGNSEILGSSGFGNS